LGVISGELNNPEVTMSDSQNKQAESDAYFVKGLLRLFLAILILGVLAILALFLLSLGMPTMNG
jgi:hypothetical protein